ncbi:MAG: TIGR04442 family protein [Nitrospiraceae bacterium]|nr:TIGR04442 family protein [Nitrospiraceae bacterium]
MIKDLRFHGSLGRVDFSVHICGPEAKNPFLYEESPESVRFFSKGNELIITAGQVRYRGTGGSFCEYMFGVEKSLKDLVKKEVLNRLIMFGAFLDSSERLVFTNNTEGSEPFERLFLQGNAVKNYYFFISSDYGKETRRRQKEILGEVGKFLKRTDLLSQERDSELIDGFLKALKEPAATVFIFKLLHRNNQAYYNAFKELYFRDKNLRRDDELYLSELAARLGIELYQQERMKIDIMYRHPENRPIADQHRDILISALEMGELEYSQLARLRRLKTLSIRNRIPGLLFEKLDGLLLRGGSVQEPEEKEYLRESRSILETLFFKDPALKSNIIRDDIIKLIRAKHRAYTEGDMGFEQLLLDVGKLCDETARESGDYSPLEELSSIITYFDRYDHVQSNLSQLAFRQDMNLKDDFLRSLIGNKKEFDSLEDGLFNEIFVKDLLGNKYITNYGKRKIKTLADGVGRVVTGDASLRDVIAGLRMISDEERLYGIVHSLVKQKLRGLYPEADSKEGREEIRREIERELIERGIAVKVPGKLFEKCFYDIRKESFYLNHLLPVIIKTTDTRLREDFILNSGLDRFYIETMEKNYFEEKKLDKFLLELLRESAEPQPG